MLEPHDPVAVVTLCSGVVDEWTFVGGAEAYGVV